MSSKKSYFFLHYGPGGNCDAERSYWGSDKGIYFWDQPAATTFEHLVQSCVSKFETYAQQNQCQGIIGHSFGCDLAVEMAKRLKHLPAKVILIAPIPNLYIAFENLAKRVLKSGDVDATIRIAIESKLGLLKSGDISSLWDLVFSTYQYPNIGRIFWANDSAFAEYANRSKTFKAMDLGVWQNILTDYVKNYSPVLLKENPEPQRDRTWAYMGRHDPYTDGNSSESDQWLKIARPERILVDEDSGHWPHLESANTFLKFISGVD